MGRSDVEPTIDELCRRLTEAELEDELDVMAELQRAFLEDFLEWSDQPSSESVEILEPYLDHEDSRLRSGAAFLLSVVLRADIYRYDLERVPVDQTALGAKLLELVDDESRQVRQVIVSTGIVAGIVEDALREESLALDGSEEVPFEPKSTAWLAVALFQRLDDPAPIVRKRVASHLESHGVKLLEAHPDTPAAVETLVDTFDDDLDGLAPHHDAMAPRLAALRTLSGYADHDSELVADHVRAIGDMLDDEDSTVASVAARLVVDLVEDGAVTMETVVPYVVEALEAGRYSLFERTREFAIDLAIENPTAADVVYDEVFELITAGYADYSRKFQDHSTVESLARLVRESDVTADPVAETLVELIDDVDFDETDPLVPLARRHPEFVAEQLQIGYRLVRDGELSGRDRFDRDLLATVARENRTAIDGVPEIVSKDLSNRKLLRALYELSTVAPDGVASTFPDSLRTAHRNPPIRTKLGPLIEVTADQWEGIPEDVVDDLVATAEYEKEQYSSQRRRAVRALVALYENDHDAVPDRVAHFADPYHEGLFDDDRPTDEEPVDPLQTDAAAAGDWIPDDAEWL